MSYLRRQLLRVLAIGLVSSSWGVLKAAPGEFRAGTGKAIITPREPGWLGGYSHRSRVAEGIAAELWTRALALEDGEGNRRVVVNADIHIFSRRQHREIVELAQQKFKLGERELMLIATHNHSGPALPDGFEPYINWNLDSEEMRRLQDAADLIRDRVLESIGQALSNLRPARLFFSRGAAAFGVNRRVLMPDGNYDFGAVPEGVADPEVPVLSVETLEGRPLAVVFTYACHCTSIRRGQDGYYKYHPDFAGVAAREIESRLTGATAIFATGCAGDIDPQPQGGIQQAEANGRSLADSVMKVYGKGRQLFGSLRVEYREIALPLGPIPAREKFVEMAASTNGYRQRHARWTLERIDAGTLPREVPYPIQVWRFGSDLALVGLAGEVCVDYALRLKRELGPERIWPVAYANEVPGYIPSERILKEGGYEAGWDQSGGPRIPSAGGSTIFYGWAVPFAEGLEDLICRTVAEMVK